MAHRLSPLLIALALATTGNDARAAFTATYALTGQTGFETTAAATSTSGNTAGTTFGDIARSPDLVAGVAGANAINAQNFSNSTTFPGTNLSYYSFTVTPGAGATLSISLIDFFVRRSGTGPQDLDLRSSLDNYGSSLLTAVLDPLNYVEERAAVNLSGITSAVTFRLFAYGATTNQGTLRISDSQGPSGPQGSPALTIGGNAVPLVPAVPEPTSIILVGLGLIAAAIGLRRKAA